MQGRRAEILGDAGLPSDIEMRRWRHYEEAQTGFARLSPQLQKNYRAFIAGVKRYTADHPDRVPKWAPELNPEILVAVSRAIYWVGYNQGLGPADCAKSGVTLQLGLDGRGPETTQRASNEWLVRPPLTRGGKPQQMEVHKEVFRSASGKVVERDFEYTHHNGVLSAVVARQGRIAYAVSMSQMHDAGLYDDEVYRMNRATSVQELREAMKTLGSLPQNLMAADERGGAYYLRAGKTPKRPTGYDWSAAVPGNTSATAWLGIHPLEEMIEVLNPPQGYMQNNNTAPERLFADGNLDPVRYPAWMFNDRPGRVTTRGQRALEVLSQAKDFTVDDAKALAFDEYWITTPSWRGALANAVKHQRKSYRRLSAPARKLVDRIVSFDGYARADSAAALNFWFWRGYTGAAWDAHPGFAALRTFPLPAQLTPAFERALLAAAEAAAKEQIDAVGDVDQPLGRLFRIGHGGPSLPLGGATIHPNGQTNGSDTVVPDYDSTLRAFEFTPTDKNGERLARQGSQAMRLMVWGDGKLESWSLYAFGQQTAPGRHFGDQVPLFSRREFKPALFDRDDLMQHLESTTVLEVPVMNP